MVISTVSTPDEHVEPFRFVAGQPSTLGVTGAPSMARAASHNAVQTSLNGGPPPMTRNRSGTTGPWPQSPLLLNPNLRSEGAVQESTVSPALTTIIHSGYVTPQIDADFASEQRGEEARVSQSESAVQGLGLDFGYPTSKISSDVPQHRFTHDEVKGFAPITTDLLRQASRSMIRNPQETASPHLSIQMSPIADQLQPTRHKSKEALLTRGSRQALTAGSTEAGLGYDLVTGPSPVLPNDCRSPRTASGKEVGSSAPGSLSALINGPVTVQQAQMGGDRAMLQSQSIASSISAFVYNATPAPTAAEADGELQGLDVPSKSKTGSIGWRSNARRGRDQAQMLRLRMRPDKHSANDSADVKFVNINLEDGGRETEVAIDHDEGNKTGESAKAGQWVSKLWSAVSSPRRPSFNLGTSPGDRSVDLELANGNAEERMAEKTELPAPAPAPVAKDERTASRGSYRPLSLVEKRQSSGRSHLAMSRQRFRSPTPGEDDEVAEKDARAVALRLLAGSPHLPPPTEEGNAEAVDEHSTERGDLSAEEREKERLEALKKLRRMSAVERQRKRNSGIGYITSTSAAVEGAARLPYLHNSGNYATQQEGEAATHHNKLSRTGSVNDKRMSITMFGGKERASTLPVPAANESGATAKAVPERAWLDAVRSPRVAESPSGFTPRMMFEPQDWGASSAVQHKQQQEQVHGHRQASTGSTANHIPLILSSSNGATLQRQPPSASVANDHGLTVSELDRARDEMRRLAGQGIAWKEDEVSQDAAETFHTPLPDAPGSWSPTEPQRSRYHTNAEPDTTQFDSAHHPTTQLDDFGISPEKKEARLHRRTRTARFAVNEDYPAEQDTEDQPAVSIFTRSQHRHRASGSFSFQYGSHGQPRSRAQRNAAGYHGPRPGGQGLFATPASLLDGNTPSKNLFWAGFLGMPWLWMIGGWYLTPDGQLRHPSADDPRLRRKVDVWQHEPSMQHQHSSSANNSPIPGPSSTMFGGMSYEQSWTQGQSGSQAALGLGLSGMPSVMSYAASSTGTANSARTTNSDPNRPPPSKTRKSKTRSLGSLLDTNPLCASSRSPSLALVACGATRRWTPFRNWKSRVEAGSLLAQWLTSQATTTMTTITLPPLPLPPPPILRWSPSQKR